MVQGGHNAQMKMSTSFILICLLPLALLSACTNDTTQVVIQSNGSADTNESVFVGNLIGNCSADYLMWGVLDNGTIVCVADQLGEPGSSFDLNLTNGSTDLVITDGEVLSLLAGDGIRVGASGNTITITNTVTDTTYSNGSGLNLSDSNNFSILPEFSLPQGCGEGQVAEWDDTGKVWYCDDDDVGLTEYTETDPRYSADNTSIVYEGDCPAGQVVMNLTHGGPECVTMSAGVFLSGIDSNIYYHLYTTNGTVYLNFSNATGTMLYEVQA